MLSLGTFFVVFCATKIAKIFFVCSDWFPSISLEMISEGSSVVDADETKNPLNCSVRFLFSFNLIFFSKNWTCFL